jgi:hypothetical protein
VRNNALVAGEVDGSRPTVVAGEADGGFSSEVKKKVRVNLLRVKLILS